ncbi:MAG: hypothetical protein ACTHJW_02835, partial [Streptosporangiaceae bacterium]
QTEISQERAGRSATAWQTSLAAYLLQITAGGQYPNLAAALADHTPQGGTDQSASLFDLAMTRILRGLIVK